MRGVDRFVAANNYKLSRKAASEILSCVICVSFSVLGTEVTLQIITAHARDEIYAKIESDF
jgi:hypothetical protein